MIVDVHTHLWASAEQLGPASAERIRRRQDSPWARPDGSPQAHEAATQSVSYAFVLGLEARAIQASIPLAAVAASVARRPDKLIGFAGIDPCAPDALARVDGLRRLGLAGVVLSPGPSACPLGDPRSLALLQRAADLDLPVILHPDTHLAPASTLDLLSPQPLDAILRRLPRLRVVIAQVGDPFTDLTLALLERHEHLYADLSEVAARPAQLRQVLLMAAERRVASKLFMGSDYPFHSPEATMAALYAVHSADRGGPWPCVPRETIHAIVHRDVLACLNIPVPAAAAPAPNTDAGVHA